MKFTFILTVHDRPEIELLRVLQQIAKNDLRDAEVLVIDDGSETDYSDVIASMEPFLPLRWERWPTLEHKPETYHISGHKNPAFVNNKAIELAHGENLIWLSSDVLIPSHTVERLGRWDLSTRSVTARIIDIDTGNVFCGKERPMFACWLLACSKANALAVDGFDEELLKGMAFDDNDFTAKLALLTGKMVIDSSILAFHQSHAPLYLSDGGVGYQKSHKYVLDKWGGIPWDVNHKIIATSVSDVGKTTIYRCSPGSDCIYKGSAIHAA